MKALVRGTLAATALAMVAATAEPLAAQGRQKEIRLDFLSLQTSDGDTRLDAAFPGGLAVAFYLNESVAIEPRFALDFQSGDGIAEGTVFSAGLFMPFYLAGDTGRSGFFLSPGIELTKGTGDREFDTQVNYGVDAGMKMTRNDRVSTRLALTIRDGDSFGDPVLGAVFGIGLFWR